MMANRVMQLFFIACCLSTIFALPSLTDINDDTKSLIYSFQRRFCGKQFCSLDSSYTPPFCRSTDTIGITNDVGNGSISNENISTTTSDLYDVVNTTDVLTTENNTKICDPCEPCSCEDSCIVYGSCCADKHIGRSYPFSCTMVNTFSRDQIHDEIYYIVTTCLPDAPNYNYDLANKCEYGQLGYIQDGRFVKAVQFGETDVIFRNKHCAMCYNVMKYIPLDVYITCEDNLDSSNFTDINAVIRSVTESNFCLVAPIYATKNLSLCLKRDVDIVSTCNVTGKWKDYNESIETACHTYYNPVLNWKYKNMFCHMCNGEPIGELECPTGCMSDSHKPVNVMPFAAMLNFENSDAEVIKTDVPSYPIKRIGRQVAHQCREADIYDARSSKCREIYCSLSRREEEYACVKLVSSEQLVVTAWNLTAVFSKEIEVVAFQHGWQTSPTEPVFILIDKLVSKIGLRITDGISKTYGSIKSTHVLAIRESYLELFLILLPNSSLETSRQQLSLVNNITMNITFEGSAMTVVNIPEGNDEIPKDKLLIFNSGFGVFTSDFEDKSKYIEVPLAFNVTCPTVRFENHEVEQLKRFIIINEKTVVTEHEYFVDKNGAYYICVEAVLRPEQTTTTLHAPEYCSTVTTVCLSCSIISLLLTLGVYISDKELHNVPGLNLIFLSSSMFVAQILYLFGAGSFTTPTVCTVIGVLIHYFWLVTFTWMNVCCLHMFRVFTSMYSSVYTGTEKTYLILKYSAFAYGLPVVIVAITLVTTYILSDYSGVAYGGPGLCFVTRCLVSVISFGVPVGLTVFITGVLLVVTVKSIKKIPKESRPNGHSEASDVFKFFKLSTITGLSWMFGILGYFLQRLELMYVFTVLAAGQGVFIFLSFAASKRILAILRKTIFCPERRKRNAEQGQNSTTTLPQSRPPSIQLET